jgi:hypothetical protein
MADSVRATPIVIIPGETAPLGFNFTDLLNRGVNPEAVVASVVSIQVVPAEELAFSNAQPNATPFRDEFGRLVAAQHGITAIPGGAVAGKNYDVTVTIADSDGSIRKGIFPVWTRS